MGFLNLATPEDVRAFTRVPDILNCPDEVIEAQIEVAEALMLAYAPEGYRQDGQCRKVLELCARMLTERLLIASDPDLLAAQVRGVRKEQMGSYSYERFPDGKISASVISSDIGAMLDACRAAGGGVVSYVVQPMYTDVIYADEALRSLAKE